MRKRRNFSQNFKRQTIEAVQSGQSSLAEILRKHEISPSTYYKWQDDYQRGKLDNEPTSEGAYLNRIAELERKVGQQAMEIDLLKKLKQTQQQKLSELSLPRIVTGLSKGGAK